MRHRMLTARRFRKCQQPSHLSSVASIRSSSGNSSSGRNSQVDNRCVTIIRVTRHRTRRSSKHLLSLRPTCMRRLRSNNSVCVDDVPNRRRHSNSCENCMFIYVRRRRRRRRRRKLDGKPQPNSGTPQRRGNARTWRRRRDVDDTCREPAVRPPSVGTLIER
jgi:hypothetical protein